MPWLAAGGGASFEVGLRQRGDLLDPARCDPKGQVQVQADDRDPGSAPERREADQPPTDRIHDRQDEREPTEEDDGQKDDEAVAIEEEDDVLPSGREEDRQQS